MSPSAVHESSSASLDARTNVFKKANSDESAIAVGAQTKDGRSAMPTYPKFATKEEERLYCKQHLACAFRVFAARGYDEGVAGHMSLRDPVNPKHFWINPYTMHFADIKVSDLVCVDEDANVVEGHHAVNAAGFQIHSEIHKAHPHINAICHAHTIYGKSYSVFGKPLPPMTQDALRFYDSHSVLDEYGGVVLSTDEGKAIAGALRVQDKVCILQNHGLISVGETIDEAAFWFICFDKCCQSQLIIDSVVRAQEGKEGFKANEIDHETAKFTADRIGTRQRGWLNFQSYFNNMVRTTGGDFLQ